MQSVLGASCSSGRVPCFQVVVRDSVRGRPLLSTQRDSEASAGCADIISAAPCLLFSPPPCWDPSTPSFRVKLDLVSEAAFPWRVLGLAELSPTAWAGKGCTQSLRDTWGFGCQLLTPSVHPAEERSPVWGDTVTKLPVSSWLLLLPLRSALESRQAQPAVT